MHDDFKGVGGQTPHQCFTQEGVQLDALFECFGIDAKEGDADRHISVGLHFVGQTAFVTRGPRQRNICASSIDDDDVPQRQGIGTFNEVGNLYHAKGRRCGNSEKNGTLERAAHRGSDAGAHTSETRVTVGASGRCGRGRAARICAQHRVRTSIGAGRRGEGAHGALL